MGKVEGNHGKLERTPTWQEENLVVIRPTAAVTVKRLHDRGRSGLWALLIILAWMLLAGNWAILPGMWQWVVGRFAPTLILIMTLIDLGAFVGTQGENKYGKDTQDVAFKSAP